MADAKLMTNIKQKYYQFLEQQSKQRGVTKRQLTEDAFELLIRDYEKQKMIDSFREMANDADELNEMRALAELDMDYYLEDINNANL
ncbi:hypothetical protein IPJ72_00350 [Candidatus Peregrinibacteria bacterium]|nr:MAG: hypothetical protein IPJ72_00350 [Candidatus Peregrinibacteria bacterium]